MSAEAQPPPTPPKDPSQGGPPAPEAEAQPPPTPPKDPSQGGPPASEGKAETPREKLEKGKLALEKQTQMNASLNEYVTKAEKADEDVARALENYKNAVGQLQLAKQDADYKNDSQSKEATTEVGEDKAAAVTEAVKKIDDPIDKLEGDVKDLPKTKTESEAKYSDAQKALDDALAELQRELAYQTNVASSLRAVTDIQAKVQKVNDHAHPAEFYFYTSEAAKLLQYINVDSWDDRKKKLTDKLEVVRKAFTGAIQAKNDSIEAKVNLDFAQKKLADLKKNREAQILAAIKQYDTVAAKPSKTAAAK
jgi:hypothetical protein